MVKKSEKKSILVTGSEGQLGQCIKKIQKSYPEIDLCFTSAKNLDITRKENVKLFFLKNHFDIIINCAGYTNVEQAEKEPGKAFLVNATGVRNLSEICLKKGTILIHISTDYVFDGESNIPYTEEDQTNPINEYGKSKLEGEKYILETLDKYFIIRTSWLYSEFGHNFFKTISKKSETEEKLKIVKYEKGTPTNANDLAKFLLDLIQLDTKKYGIYHYSNLGEGTWYDFAKEILDISGKLEYIKLEKTDNYPTFARRPKYSVLSKEKCINSFGFELCDWKESLKKILITK